MVCGCASAAEAALFVGSSRRQQAAAGGGGGAKSLWCFCGNADQITSLRRVILNVQVYLYGYLLQCAVIMLDLAVFFAIFCEIVRFKGRVVAKGFEALWAHVLTPTSPYVSLAARAADCSVPFTTVI
jgi:hypothetical protein